MYECVCLPGGLFVYISVWDVCVRVKEIEIELVHIPLFYFLCFVDIETVFCRDFVMFES